MSARYDEIISSKIEKIQEFKRAVGALVAQREKKAETLKRLSEEIAKLNRLKDGAGAKAKEVVARLQSKGVGQEDIKKDPDYTKCLAAFGDFSSTLKEKCERVEEIEDDIRSYDERISEHKVNLQRLTREIEQIKAEKSDAVADMISSQQEKEINDALSGISDDGSEAELSKLRDLRMEAKAEAKISGELAGSSAQAQESEFLSYSQATESNSEFEALVGLALETDVPKKQLETKAGLPE